MPASAADQLREFHDFLTQALKAGAVNLSPEEALDEWRRLHPDTRAQTEDMAALQEALEDLANGDRGIPIDQFDREFRQRHNLPASP
jgi:hypothetical protein